MKKSIILLTIVLTGLYSCKSEKEKFYNTTIQNEIRKKLSSPSTGVFPPYDKIKHRFYDTKYYYKDIFESSYEEWLRWKETGALPPSSSTINDTLAMEGSSFLFESDTIKRVDGIIFRSYVDAQNKFGAIVRSYYICTAYTFGDDYDYDVMFLDFIPKEYYFDLFK